MKETTRKIIEAINDKKYLYECANNLEPNAIILPLWCYYILKDELPTITIANSKQNKICGLEMIVAEDLQQFQVFRKVEISNTSSLKMSKKLF